MVECILWIPLIKKLLLVGIVHTVLQSRPEGLIVAANEAETRKLLALDSTVAVLYWSREDYDDAIRDLKLTDIDEVVKHRLAVTKLPDDAEWAVAVAIRRCVALSALTWGGAKNSALERYFDAALALLADLLREQFRGFGEKDLLTAIEMEKAHLRAEARAAQVDLPALATHFRDIEAGVTQDFAGLAETALSLGFPDLRQSELHVDVKRVYYLSPFDAGLESKLRAMQSTYYALDGGVAVQWPARRLDELANYRPRVLYVGGDRLVAALVQLARPQLLRDLRGALATTPDARAYQAWFDVLLLDSALTTQQAAKVLMARKHGGGPAVALVAKNEAARLRRLWSKGSMYATTGAPARGRLLACQRHAQTTATLALALAAAGGHAEATSRMREAQQALDALALRLRDAP